MTVTKATASTKKQHSKPLFAYNGWHIHVRDVVQGTWNAPWPGMVGRVIGLSASTGRAKVAFSNDQTLWLPIQHIRVLPLRTRVRKTTPTKAVRS